MHDVCQYAMVIEIVLHRFMILWYCPQANEFAYPPARYYVTAPW